MVSPARRREAVSHLQESFEVGQRRACRIIGQPRSTQRYQGKQASKDRALIADIRRIAGREPRAGYRAVTRLLQREGWAVNLKRVHRLWKSEGLKVPGRKSFKRRRRSSCNGNGLRAKRINHVWSYDFLFDQTDDGGRLKWLPVVDEYSREAIGLKVERSITAQDVVEVLEGLVEERGMPELIRSDNGPEFIAHAVRNWITERGFSTRFIKPGSPWQNPYIESFGTRWSFRRTRFGRARRQSRCPGVPEAGGVTTKWSNSRFRDEFLNLEVFGSLVEAKVLGESHRYKYNHQRPHSSLDNLTPAEFASRCTLLPAISNPAP